MILARVINAERFPPVRADRHPTRCKTSATEIKAIYVGFQVGVHFRYPTPAKLVVTAEYGGAQNFSQWRLPNPRGPRGQCLATEITLESKAIAESITNHPRSGGGRRGQKMDRFVELTHNDPDLEMRA